MKREQQRYNSNITISEPHTIPASETNYHGSGLVLIFGIEHGFNKSLQQLLLLHRYKTHIASTVPEAESLQNKYRFDLIMLDLSIIELLGKQVIKDIINKQSWSKRIMFSNDTVFDKAVWALRNGADDYFKIPYTPDDLLCSIKNLLDREAEARKKQEKYHQLIYSEILHRFMISNSPDVIYLLDRKGQFSYFNRQVKSLLGFSREELLGKHYSTLIHPQDLEKSRYVFRERRTGKRAARNIELRLTQKENSLNSTVPCHVSIELNATGIYRNSMNKEADSFLGTYGVIRDISDRKTKQNQIHHQLYHDKLTNLPNRSLFMDRLRLTMSQSRRYNHSFAVMFLDIDGFKSINDTYGHIYGDNLLQTFSLRLRSCLRESDTLARISGDEFAILIPCVRGQNDTTRIAKKILQEFQVPFILNNGETRIGISIGIALAPENGESDEELLQKADWAMYHVKHHGKNDFAYYNESHKMTPSYVTFPRHNDIVKADR